MRPSISRAETTGSAKIPSSYDALGSRSLVKRRGDFDTVTLKLFMLTNLEDETRSLLQAMAFFDPNDIRERYLVRICQLYHHARKNGYWEWEVFLPDFPSDLEKDPGAFRRALNELLKEGYIGPNDNGLGYYLEHEVRVVQLDQLSKDRELFDAAFRALVWVLFDIWPMMTDGREPNYEKYAEYNFWGQRDELVIHIASLERLFTQVTPTSPKLKRDSCTQRYIRLLTEAAW